MDTGRDTGTLAARATAGGVLVPVVVVPRASRTGVGGVRDGRLLLRLTAPPVDGAANAAMTRVLARALGVPRAAIRIVRGERSRRKEVLVTDLAVEDLLAKLSE